jgi:hypothetical protein
VGSGANAEASLSRRRADKPAGTPIWAAVAPTGLIHIKEPSRFITGVAINRGDGGGDPGHSWIMICVLRGTPLDHSAPLFGICLEQDNGIL